LRNVSKVIALVGQVLEQLLVGGVCGAARQQRVDLLLQAGDLEVQVSALVGPGGDDLVAVVAVVAVGGWQQRLIVGDLDRGSVDDVLGAVQQVVVSVADGEGVEQQPAHGVRDLGLPGDGTASAISLPARRSRCATHVWCWACSKRR
jgi:hypothetical protein